MNRQNGPVRAAVRILSLACCLAACAVIGGGQWGALQTVAWARMAVDYTREAGSLRQGLAETFDGEHPCEWCRQIKAGVEKEGYEQRQKPGKEETLGKIKLVAVLTVASRMVFSSAATDAAMSPCLFRGRLLDAPPTPPPRAA